MNLHSFLILVFACFYIFVFIVWHYQFNLSLKVNFFLLPTIIIVIALLQPSLLKYIYIAFSILGYYLGMLNTLLFLSTIFYFVITPIALLMRLRNKDFMKRRFDKSAESYRKNVNDKIDMERMF